MFIKGCLLIPFTGYRDVPRWVSGTIAMSELDSGRMCMSHGDAKRDERFKRDGLRGHGPNAFKALLLVSGLGSLCLFQDARGSDRG